MPTPLAPQFRRRSGRKCHPTDIKYQVARLFPSSSDPSGLLLDNDSGVDYLPNRYLGKNPVVKVLEE